MHKKLRIASFAEQLVNLEPYAALQRRFQEHQILAAVELNARLGLEPASARGETNRRRREDPRKVNGGGDHAFFVGRTT